MIAPTVGRIVWYTPDAGFSGSHADQPLAAIVAYVWNERCVNLMVIDANGVSSSVTSVTLIQDGDPKSEHGRYCEWMPYQKGQAAKYEALEAEKSISV